MQTRGDSAQLDRGAAASAAAGGGPKSAQEPRGGGGPGARSVPAAAPGRRGPGISEGPGLARTLAGGAGRWTAARLEQEVHGVPRSPRRRALSPGRLRSPAAAAARDQLETGVGRQETLHPMSVIYI